MIRRKRIAHDVASLLPALKEALEKEPGVLFAYVFGSYGRGTPGPLSDVDVAVFLNEAEDAKLWDAKLKLIGSVTSALKTDEVDLVLLNQTPLSLRYQVLKSGRVLFSRDEPRRLQFEETALQLYLDAEPLRQRAWQSLMRRIEGGQYGR